MPDKITPANPSDVEESPHVRHRPVLVAQVLEHLNPQPNKHYLDVTFGSGGHTRAILEKEPTCRVTALDWDKLALEQFGTPLQEEFGNRLSLVWGNFGQLYAIAKREGFGGFDGILADFGTSYMHIYERAGFSVYRDTPLDMRMSRAHHVVTAQEVLARSSVEKLANIFWQLGEERYAKIIAHAIVNARRNKPIATTRQLAELIEQVVPGAAKQRTIHPATKVFQALRIYVNHELENIGAFLHAATRLLAPGGKLVCISFHSLEDRLVKQFFREQAPLGVLAIGTPHAVVADEVERQENPSSRSAKLRAAYRCITSGKGG